MCFSFEALLTEVGKQLHTLEQVLTKVLQKQLHTSVVVTEHLGNKTTKPRRLTTTGKLNTNQSCSGYLKERMMEVGMRK